jgi:hypothetical protein
MADRVSVTLRLDTGKRWWFEPARIATVALIAIGIIRNTDRAAEWLVRNGMFRVVTD